MTDNTKKKIVVVGMHRSGTSVLINILREAGCFVGEDDDLLQPNDANKMGYGERVDIVNINKKVLEFQELDWMSVNQFDTKKITPDQNNEVASEIEQVINKLDKHDAWAIKDPRLCITWPVWEPYLKDSLIIICHRPPDEIARSLYARNNLPIALGYALWELYIKSLILNTAGHQRKIVNYHELIESPNEVVSDLMDWLNKDDALCIQAIEQDKIENIIDPKLYRQRRRNSNAEDQLTRAQYNLLMALNDRKIPKVSNMGISESLSQDIINLFNNGRDLSNKIRILLSSSDDAIRKKVEEVSNKEKKINLLNIELTNKDITINNKDITINKLRFDKQQLVNRVNELKDLLQQKERVVLEQQGAKKQLESRVSELKELLQQKETIVIERRGTKKLLEARVSELKNLLQQKERVVLEQQGAKKQLESRVSELKELLQQKETIVI